MSWPMFRHDPQHTGRSLYRGAQSAMLKWRFKTESGIASSPAIGSDGTIYIGSNDGYIYAISSARSISKKEPLWEMPILDVKKRNNKTRDALLSLYDKVCESELKSLPEEFANPSVRRSIDEGFNEALGLKIKLDSMYELLSIEPMVRGR